MRCFPIMRTSPSGRWACPASPLWASASENSSPWIRPPRAQPDTFNWGSTLWHEFTHVITLQITDHKIPRWFSEGLSVYEERKAFPGWGDDLKLDYLRAIKDKKLLPIAELNDGFIRPKFPEQVLVSYYQASLLPTTSKKSTDSPPSGKCCCSTRTASSTADVFKEALNVSLDAVR